MNIKKYKIAILFIVLSVAWSRLSAQDDMFIFTQDNLPVCDTVTVLHQTYPNKDAALANMQEGEFGQIEGNDSMYVKTADNKLVSVGTVLSADFRYENKGKLDENIPYIIFSKPENANLAFDNNSGNYFDNVYRIKDTYEKLNTKYTVPWLAMNPGKTVRLDATPSGEIEESTVKFIIPLSGGSTLQLEHNGTFDVQIPGGKAGTTTEIFALATIDGTNKVVGKLKLANYAAKTQKVNLVPVRRDKASIDGEAIEKELNRIYGERLGITFEVSVKERFGEKNAGDPDDELEFLNDGLQVDDKNFWSNESSEMKYLKYLYHEAHTNEIDKEAAYIFVIGFAERPEVQGDMPRGKQTGYVFCDTEETFSDGHLIAHELGHGIYGLEHTFATGYGVPQGSTNNLMDYVNNDFLASWQWKIINNPGFVWNFLEGDEDAMHKNLNYNNNPIIINGVSYNFETLSNKVETIKTKLTPIIGNLTQEEKLILDLPLIQWKLGFKYGAVCMIHWLEGSRTSLKFPYDFFMSVDYMKDIDIKNIKEYFSKVKYISKENLGYTPSYPYNIFLYDTDIDAIRKAYNLATTKFDYGNFGYNVPLGTHIDDDIVSWNLTASLSLGKPLGSFDEVGVALGRFSQKVYIKGNIFDGAITKFIDIESFDTRFTDVFTFNDSGFWESIRSQDLGCWSKDINNTFASKYPLTSGTICLQNNDFIKLKDKAKAINVSLGGDFFIYSDIKTIKNENILEESIPIY